MRHGLRVIRSALGEEVTAEGLRRYYRDHSRRFAARLSIVLLGSAMHGVVLGWWSAAIIAVVAGGMEIVEERLARRVLRRPIAEGELAGLCRRSFRQGVLYAIAYCAVVALTWGKATRWDGDVQSASLLAAIVALGVAFDAGFLAAHNRRVTLAKIALYGLTVLGCFAAEVAVDGWTQHQAVVLFALAILSFMGVVFAVDVRGGRRRQARTNTALAEQTAALERALADLTEKTRAMRRLALAAEHASDSIVITDAQGRIEWVNGGFTARTGWSLAEVAGRPRRSLADPGGDPSTFQAIDAAAAARRPFRGQLRLWCRGGRSVWHEVSLTPLFGEGGEVENYISVEHDISRLKAREEELARQGAELRRLALVAEHARDAIVLYAPDGVIEWVNPGFTAQTGYEAAEVVGGAAGALAAPDADPGPLLRIRAAMAAERAVRAELRLRRKDGGAYWCEVSLSPVRGPDGALRHYVGVERDVTEAKAREAELAEKDRENRRLALVARHATDSIVLSNAEGFVEWVNASFTERSGWSPDDVRGWPLKRFVAPDCDPDALAALQTAAREGRAHRTELRLSRRGASVWYDLISTPIRDEEGRIVHWISVERDISEAKAREAELAEKDRENRRLALVTEHATDSIMLADADGCVEWVNASFTAESGWSLADVAGRRVRSFVSPDCDPAALAGLGDAVREARPFRSELLVARDGGAVWHDVIATPIRGEGGGIVHWVIVERDISEAKAREAELARMERENRRLALAARHAGDCIFLTGPDGAIEWVNDALAALAGLGPDDVRGEHLASFVAPDCDARALAAIQAATRARRPHRTQLKLMRRGESVWHDVRQSPIHDEDGALIHWVSVERDITDLKLREEELARARHDAEAAAEAKSRFLATMSHEIRTPMNGIIGTADLLSETALDDDQRRLLRTIALSSEALLRIINDILDLSKLEAQHVEIAPEPFDPGEVIEVCGQLLRPLADAKGIDLAVGWDGPKPPPRLLGDAGRIQQIVLNLLGNAIRFTEVGGVALHAEALPAGEEGTRRLVLSVSDTGIGIAPDRLEGVFDAFAQADETITRRFGGTGLGLSISRQLARAMEGDIAVASTPGEGSTFTLTLDLPPAGAAPTGPAPEEAAPGAPGLPQEAPLLLVVEDNATNRFLVQRMLDGAGLRIAVAEDGAEGVAAFERLSPDLVLMDVSMPVMDGLEATRRIRAIEAARGGAPRPILALTANAHLAPDGGAEGVSGFLTKPIRKAELRAAVAAALAAGGAARDPAEEARASA